MKSQQKFIIDVKDFKINQTSSICNIELNRQSENQDRSDSCTQECKHHLCTQDLSNAERKKSSLRAEQSTLVNKIVCTTSALSFKYKIARQQNCSCSKCSTHGLRVYLLGL